MVDATASEIDVAAAGGRPAERRGAMQFAGRFWPLFGLALRMALLTIFTLGVYRFWMKTRLRQYYWSHLRIDGEPLEYGGRGVEMLIGFLIAISFLAIYLFIVNFALSFYSLAYWDGFEPAIALSLLAVTPLVPFAQYRAQRYRLARTRWRGIRFGLDLAAWRYTGLYLMWMLATVASLGLLWPVADFYLRRFITARMRFGDQHMRLDGGPARLYLGYAVYYVPVAAIAAWIFTRFDPSMLFDPFMRTAILQVVVMQALIYLAPVWFLLSIWYQGYRLRYFLNRTRIGDQSIIESGLSPTGLFVRLVWGGFLGVLVTGLLVLVLIIVLMLAMQAAGVGLERAEWIDSANLGGGSPSFAELWPMLLLGGAAYLIGSAIYLACYEVFVTRRVLGHVAGETAVTDIDGLERTRQRPEDEAAQAEGFADALDVGAF